MRILILVQKFDPNDSILGFLYTWFVKIARQIDELYIVTFEQRYTAFPKNTQVYSFGRELGYHKIRQLYNFNKTISEILLKRKVDLAFVLMCPEYVFLIAPYAKIARIPIVMWYTHGNTDMKLKIAHLLVNKVVTASKESFRIKSNKVIITGHGIDVDKFKNQNPKSKNENNEKKIILSVGRISPIKNYETLIRAADILINQNNFMDLKFQIVGGVPVKSQDRYLYLLKNIVRKYKLKDYVQFVGPIPYTQIQDYYENCDLFVSTSNTGSLDKAVLEAMACGKVILTCNEAFNVLLKNYSNILLFDKNNPNSLVEKIVHALDMDVKDRHNLACDLRETAVRNHSLNRFLDNIFAVFNDAINYKIIR